MTSPSDETRSPCGQPQFVGCWRKSWRTCCSSGAAAAWRRRRACHNARHDGVLRSHESLYNPTGAEYFGKGGRAFVVGGLSGAFTSAATFALFGTALGPVGIVVGFIIGLAAYLLIDYMIGQQVETGLRRVVE